MRKLSLLDHPASVGETYVEHFRMSASFGLAMLAGGCACLVHAAIPFLCTSTGSSTVKRLYTRMVTARVTSHPESHGAALAQAEQ
jgi:hypothetical protein